MPGCHGRAQIGRVLAHLGVGFRVIEQPIFRILLRKQKFAQGSLFVRAILPARHLARQDQPIHKATCNVAVIPVGMRFARRVGAIVHPEEGPRMLRHIQARQQCRHRQTGGSLQPVVGSSE